MTVWLKKWKILCFSPPFGTSHNDGGNPPTVKTGRSHFWAPKTTGSPSWSSSTWVVIGSSKAASHGLPPVSLRLPTFRFGGVVLGGSTAGPPKNPEICKNPKPWIMWIQSSSEYDWNFEIVLFALEDTYAWSPIDHRAMIFGCWTQKCPGTRATHPKDMLLKHGFNFPTKRWTSAVVKAILIPTTT